MNSLLHKLQNVPWKKVLPYTFFPITIFYYEVLFLILTNGQFQILDFLILTLFSFHIGLLFSLIQSLLCNKLLKTIISSVICFIFAIPYAVEVFVFRQFKVFYDVKTITGGASDAMTGFASDILHMIFSFEGIVFILLLILPTVLCVILSLKQPEQSVNIKKSLVLILTSVICYILAITSIFLSPALKALYTKEYNYQTMVHRLGLYTGIRMDTKQILFHKDNDLDFDFDIPTEPEGSTSLKEETTQEPTTPEPTTPEPTTPEPTTPEPTTPEPTTPEPTTPEPTTPEPTTPEPTTKKPTNDKVSTNPWLPASQDKNELSIDFSLLAKNANDDLANLDLYVSSLSASYKNDYTGLFKGKNLIFITAEAFAEEVIDPELTPTLYRLANKGIQFTDYYQPASAGTTGGEYNNLIGMLPTEGGMSMKDTADHLNYMTIASHLDRLGYYGKAYHNNSYTYYDRDKTHINLGYSDGYMGVGNGMEEYISGGWPQSDLEMFEGTLPTFIKKQPFNIYYMSVSGHSGYAYDSNSQTRKHWDKVQHLPYSDEVKGYFAAQLELEAALTYMVGELEKAGIAQDTVICIGSDHFPYGLDQDAGLGHTPYLNELYGYEVTTNLERDHNRLIIWSGCLESMEPIVVDEPTFSLDILPTLLNLFGCDFDSRLLPGRDVLSTAEALVFNLNYDWKTSLGTYNSSKGKFTPANSSVNIPDGYVDRIKKIVRNKITYCRGALNNDYFRHVFAK